MSFSLRERTIIAAACHSAARAYAISAGKFDTNPWEVAQFPIRTDTLEAVDLVLAGGGAEDLHNRWLERMKEKGWTVLDAAVEERTPNYDKKQHPSMVPFDELPHEERVKTVMFMENVNTMVRVLRSPINE
jgi:hypothetical protein